MKQTPIIPLTDDQRRVVRTLSRLFPRAGEAKIAALFKHTKFEESETYFFLLSEHGTPAAANLSLLPQAKIAAPRCGIPTHLPNGRTADLGEMARANGCPQTRGEVFNELYDERNWLTSKIEELQSVLDNRYSKEALEKIKLARAERDRVHCEINDFGLRWNSYLNPDIRDLHGLHSESAKPLVRNYLRDIYYNPGILPSTGLRPRTLTVVIGGGAHSINDPVLLEKIRDQLGRLALQLQFTFEPLGPGAFIISFPEALFRAAPRA